MLEANPLSDYFQQIYVINLPERTDRRDEMEEQLTSIGLSLKHPKINLFEATRPQDAGEFESIGARGCYMSHLRVLQDAKAKNLSRILIIEDDLNFSKDFLKKIEATINNLKKIDWKLYYGSYNLKEPISIDASQPTYEILFTTVLMTSPFIGFQGDIISELVDYLELLLTRKNGDSRGGPMHVDGAYFYFRNLHPSYKTIISNPELGYQRSSRTDIYTLRWYDDIIIVRDCVAFLRKLKNKLN